MSIGMKALSWPYLALGICFHAGFFALYLFALSREELSFVLPVTALDYVLVTLFATVWAGEDVGALRWAGSIAVSTGVALVVRT